MQFMPPSKKLMNPWSVVMAELMPLVGLMHCCAPNKAVAEPTPMAA